MGWVQKSKGCSFNKKLETSKKLSLMYWNLYFYSKVKYVVILRHIICYNKLIKQSNRLVDIMWFGRPFESREIGHVVSFSIWILIRKQGIPFMTLQVWVKNRIRNLYVLEFFLCKLGFSLLVWSKNNMPPLFQCRYGNCKYQSYNF